MRKLGSLKCLCVCSKEALGTLRRQGILSVCLLVARRPGKVVCACSKKAGYTQLLSVCSKEFKDFEEASYTQCFSVCSKAAKECSVSACL